MDSSAAKVGPTANHLLPADTLSKLKTYGFAIAIIIGIGSLATGAAGLAGFFRIGALRNMAQVNAIIMMAIGGGAITILLMIGLTKKIKSISSTDSQRCLKYGPEAWENILGVKVLDFLSPAPKIDLSKQDKVLMYIPGTIKFNDEEKTLNLKTLKEIGGKSFDYFDENVEKRFGNSVAHGWVLIDKTLMRQSRGQDYATQEKMVKEKGCNMPTILEVAAFYLLVLRSSGQNAFFNSYIRCSEEIENGYPITVGGFDPQAINVADRRDNDDKHTVVVGVNRFNATKI